MHLGAVEVSNLASNLVIVHIKTGQNPKAGFSYYVRKTGIYVIISYLRLKYFYQVLENRYTVSRTLVWDFVFLILPTMYLFSFLRVPPNV